MRQIKADRNKSYIEREGYLERVWQVWYSTKGFKFFILVQGTEPEVYDYCSDAFGYLGRHWALRDSEIQQMKEFNVPIYLAPKRGE